MEYFKSRFYRCCCCQQDLEFPPASGWFAPVHVSIEGGLCAGSGTGLYYKPTRTDD